MARPHRHPCADKARQLATKLRDPLNRVPREQVAAVLDECATNIEALYGEANFFLPVPRFLRRRR